MQGQRIMINIINSGIYMYEFWLVKWFYGNALQNIFRDSIKCISNKNQNEWIKIENTPVYVYLRNFKQS